MHPQALFYAIPLLLGATIASAFCILALQRYREPGAPAFVVAMASVALWAFAYALELISPTISEKMIWHRIIYMTSSAIPAFWLLFILQHEQEPPEKIRLWTVLLMIEPILFSTVTWTNDWWHQWLWHDIGPKTDEPILFMEIERGLGFLIHVAFTYLLVWISVIFFLRIVQRESSTLTYFQIIVLVLGILSPVIANTLHIVGFNPWQVNLTPFTLITMGASVGWLAFRFEIWDIVPAAHDAVFASMADGVIVFNLNDVIIDINPAAFHLLNIPKRRVIGHRIDELIEQYDYISPLRRALDVFRTDETKTVELTVIVEKGAYDATEQVGASANRYLDVVVSPLQDQRSRINGRILTLHDVTVRRTIQLELQKERSQLAQRVEERTADLSRANAELADAARLKDEFLATMSHELRTPLNTVLGLSEAIQDEIYGTVSPAQQRALQHVLDGGRHLLALINDILDVSKIEAGKLTLEPGPVAIDSLCQASVNFIRQTAVKKDLQIVVEIDPSVKIIFGDERRLKQILVNLLNNAVKFTPICGEIGLQVVGQPTNDLVSFTVWDRGIGIAKEDMPKLFKPFIQLDSRLTREHEGTGLGLTLVHRMVDLHGGSISVESQPGMGSQFTVNLPWHQRSLADIAASTNGYALHLTLPIEELGQPKSSSAPATTRQPAPTILLVEDNETNINVFRDYLLMRDYRLDVARSGLEALACLPEVQPDLILMDIQMPEMDGLEVTRRIRNNPPFADIPIIALTALAMPGDRERCIAAGMSDYISKPVNLRRLVQAIEEQFENQ